MKPPAILVSAACVALLACASCTDSPGAHQADIEVRRPSQIEDFAILYGQNCAGCHGPNGKGGAAIVLADPVFLTIADDTVIRRTAAEGVAGTSMPAFAQSAGGMLTDRQIDALVKGIRSWEKPETLAGVTPPPYISLSVGDAIRGAETYRTYCISCHGPEGRGGNKASSIVDGSYLSLVSDQYLRITVIAGRPESGAPDWRGDFEGRPMSAQDVSDVVAWLSSQRPQFAGGSQPSASRPQDFNRTADSANRGSR